MATKTKTKTKTKTSRKSKSTAVATGKPKRTVYEVVTDEILKKMEAGIIPWVKPWDVELAGGYDRNGVTKREYRGVNFLLTSMQGYASTEWYTLRQIDELGCRLKEGQHQTIITFFKVYLSKSENDATPSLFGDELDGGDGDEIRKRYVLRYYGVFNREQIDGLPDPPKEDKPKVEPLKRCEEVVNGYAGKPEIIFGGARAFYRHPADFVKVPKIESFKSREEFYCTLFHELVHSTGAAGRLNREMNGEFGSKAYAAEELTAEIGAAMLCRYCGIKKTIDNTVAYLQSWKQVLKDDPKCVVIAAQRAQKAVDYILGIKPNFAD